MGLLRKHMHDDAGTRVPVYRTGLWPGTLPHECPLTPDARSRILARSGSGWSPTVAWSVLVLGVLVFAMMAVFAFGYGFHTRTPRWAIAVLIVPAFMGMRKFLAWVVGNWTGFGSVGVEKLRGVMLDAGRCPSCGYELAGQETCPECAAVWKAGS